MRRRDALLPALVLCSAAAHALAYRMVDWRARPPAASPELVEMTVTAPPPPPTLSPPPALETPAPPDAAPVRRAPQGRAAPAAAIDRPAQARRAAPPRAAPAAPPAPEAPADFTGTTLTNDGDGPGWASATGDGTDVDGPVGAPRAARAPAERPPPAAPPAGRSGGASEPAVPATDLSRPPEAPNLDSRLARNYPRQAREAGVSGRAVVRTRIESDGRARALRVVSESAAGFGTACERTVDGSRWRPPLDRRGRPVPTEVSFTCTFTVGT